MEKLGDVFVEDLICMQAGIASLGKVYIEIRIEMCIPNSKSKLSKLMPFLRLPSITWIKSLSKLLLIQFYSMIMLCMVAITTVTYLDGI